MALGCTQKKLRSYLLDYLDNISILFDKDNDLEEDIIHLFNEVSIFIFKFVNTTTIQTLNIFKA